MCYSALISGISDAVGDFPGMGFQGKMAAKVAGAIGDSLSS
jgi:hypothetical protein